LLITVITTAHQRFLFLARHPYTTHQGSAIHWVLQAVTEKKITSVCH
jgi:hypothetical protein